MHIYLPLNFSHFPTASVVGEIKRNPDQCAVGASLCLGGRYCFHRCYRALSPEAMRAHAEFDLGSLRIEKAWVEELRRLIENSFHLELFHDCGVTPELLRLCGITIDDFVGFRKGGRGRYYLEHVVAAFSLTMDDLNLLGFRVPLLVHTKIYPLIVLWKLCAFRADTLFGYHLSYEDVEKCVLEADPRYATLLDLNLKFWRNVI
jgi:hypothetical protein